MAAAGRLARFEVADSSMAPALVPGDYLLATRNTASRRGDIVVFPHPVRPGLHLVKRVIGLPGETVTVAGGRVHVDGRPLVEEAATPGAGTWHLSVGEVFVLGDNRAASAWDGRDLGPLPLAGVPWRVVGRYWPPGRAGRLA